MALTLSAQHIRHRFNRVSMSEALKYVQSQTNQFRIIFIYNELEDFYVTTDVRGKSVPEAIRQLIGFYPIAMTVNDRNEIYVECTHKTEHRLKGMVVDENNLPLPYANVTMLNPADSTTVGGSVTNENGYFVIPNDHGKVIARISHVGYKPAYRLCTKDNVGTIKMILEVTALQETVITASKMQIERDGANYTLRNLGGTIMGNAGTALDLLRWTPGVIVDGNEDVSLIGLSGMAEIYVDNRKILANSELKSISSQNIKRVEVIREPDAQYASNVSPVVKLFTHRPVKDNLGASLLNLLDWKREKSNTTTLTIDGKRDKLSGNASFTYARLHTVSYSNGQTKIAEHGDETWSFMKTDTTAYASGGNDFRLFAGLNYAFTPHNIVGLQYSGNIQNMFIDQFSRLKTVQYLHEFMIMNNRVTRNSTSASYLWQRNDQSQLLLIADYATSRQSEDQDLYEFLMSIKEQDSEASTFMKQFSILNSNDYDIATATTKYDFVSKGWISHTGIEWGYTWSEGRTLKNNILQTSQRDNDWLGVYYTLGKSLGKWRVNAGLRYEYDHTRTDSEDSILNKTYHNLLPNVNLGFTPRQDLDLVLYYRRTLRRPTYSELRPTTYYISTYQESSGNPLLQPSVIDRFALNANFKGFSASLTYRLMDNAIQRIVEYKPSGVIKEFPITLKHSSAWSLDVGYNYSRSWLNLSVQSSATLPHITYPYLDGMRTERTPYAVLLLNAQFTVARKYMLGCDALYRCPWTTGFSRNASVMRANLSAMTTFFNGRLLVGITANDIFDRSLSPWSKTRYMKVLDEIHNDNDTRGVSFMARWTFNSIKNPFKKRSGNDVPLQRTQDNN